uniref:Uncharacterized protein n=1 Tax=Loxodonta africana TaxID=9785 RepID=G3ULM4_LOXAF
MRFPAQLLGLSMLWIPASSGLIVMTQTPLTLPVILGELGKLSQASYIVIFHLYQQNSGQPPGLLMSMVSNRFSGVPDWFRGTGLGTEFPLKISRVVYCQQSTQIPATVASSECLQIKS